MKAAKPKWSPSRGWAFAALFALPMALGACDDSKAKKEEAKKAPPPASTTALPFANGNGVPEFTAVPSVAPNPVPAGDVLSVTLPVDTDTSYVTAVI